MPDNQILLIIPMIPHTVIYLLIYSIIYLKNVDKVHTVMSAMKQFLLSSYPYDLKTRQFVLK